jgi:hypothetical protein
MRKFPQVLSREFWDVMVSLLLVKGTEGVGVQYTVVLRLKKKDRLEKRSLH